MRSGAQREGLRRAAGALLLGALALTVWSRTRGLTVGFWNDEAFTVYYFVERGPWEIFRGGGLPAEYSLNNHRLFSFLAWATTAVLGPSECVYRLWAVIPGIAAACGVSLWAWRRLGPWEGAALALLVALAPLHADVTTQARGYGLGLLGEMLMLVGCVRAADGERWRGFALVALGGLVGVGSLSAFAIAFAAQLVPLLFVGGCAAAAVLTLGGVGLASLAFYWPVLAALAQAGRQDFGPLVTWRNVIDGPPRDLLADSVHLWWPGLAHRPVVAIYLTLVALAVVRLRRSGDGRIAALLLSPVVGTYAALWALGAHVVPRYASYLLLHLLALVAIGLVEAVALAARRRVVALAVVALLALGAGRATWTLVLSESLRDRVPIEAYREALEAARESHTSLVVTNSRFGAGFQYYGRDLGVRFPTDDELEDLFCRKRVAFVYIHYPLFGRSTDVTCLLERNPVRIGIDQLDGLPDERMTVLVAAAR